MLARAAVRFGCAVGHALAVLALAVGLAGAAQAQTEPCSSNTGNEHGVMCIEPATSDRDINIRQGGTEISITGGGLNGHHGVYTLGGSVGAGGLGSDDTSSSARLEARIGF